MEDFDNFVANFTSAVDFQEEQEIRADTKLADLPEWDSLAALGVIIMFDTEYGVTITGGDLKACPTISSIFELIQARRK